MNLSGEAVREAAAFYHVAPANIIVVYDDINLPVGRLRVRGKGSDGGHNGIKSIVAQLGSNEFPRIRVGVGERPNPEYDLADWVLGKQPKEDLDKSRAAAKDVESAIKLILDGKHEEAMSRYSH
jgi:PTH1 family peptidyl-tRNA hydrolase